MRSEVTNKLIISVAVNGGELTLEDTPHLPLTPEEIAASAADAYRAGAAIAHIHVRGANGVPSADVHLFRKVMELIRAECDLVLNFTTDLRLPSGTDCLELRPEMASLPVGSVNLGEELITAPRARVHEVAERMRSLGVRPELEIFHEGMLAGARRLVADGAVDQPVMCQFCLGFDGGAPAEAGALLRMVDAVPRDWLWSVVGVGDSGLAMSALGIMLGGHVRVGIEDHPYFSPNELTVSNAQLVARVARLASEFGRPIATATEVRQMLKLGMVSAELTVADSIG